MAVGKLTRGSSLRMLFSLLCLLPFVESFGRSLSRLHFDSCNPGSSICVQCWDADAVNGNHPKEATNISETNCLDPNLTFGISKGTKKIYDWDNTPKGWAIHDRDEFKINVKASVGWIDTSQFSRVAIEVQLCNIDNFMLCQPIIAPTAFFDDITVLEEVQNLRTTHTPSVTRFVDLDMVDRNIVEEKLNFGKITEQGTYRILTSIILSDGTTVSGMSILSDVKYLNVIHQDPMELSANSYTAIIVFSGITSAVILYLLFQTIRYRNAQVFQLTQGKFIIAMQLCALVATCSLILFTPRDPFCQLSTPFLYLTTHMVYAILLGRMWRVRAVISPLLLLTLERKDDRTTKIVDLIGRFTACACWQKNQQKKIRMQITDYQLARVIMLLILPQLLVQVLILAVYYGNKSVLVDAQMEGVVQEIYICEYGAFYSWLHIVSASLIGLEFCLLGLLMWGSRDLPSLFNETKKVWQILRATFIFVLSGLLLIAATIDHDNTAQMRVLVQAFVLGLNMCQTCWVITWSKLRVAWKGQAILVTKLIADHNFKRTNSGDAGVGSTKYLTQQYSGFHHPSSPSPQTTQDTATAEGEEEPSNWKEGSQAEQIEPDDRSTDSSVFLAESQEVLDPEESFAVPPPSSDSFALVEASTNTMTTADSGRKGFSAMSYLRYRKNRRGSGNSRASSLTRGSTATRGSMVIRRKFVTSSVVSAKSHDGAPATRNRVSMFGNTSMPGAIVVESIDMNPRLSHDKIRISETEAPGRRLLLRMIDVQRMLAKVNTSLLTGVSLDRDDWEELRGGCVTLGEVFQNEVVFSWDSEEESSIGSGSHTTLPRRPQGYRPGNRQPQQQQQTSSLPAKSRVTSTTNAGPKRRSVTFKDKNNVTEPDELLGTMLRQPLTTILSIGNPTVRRSNGTLVEESESSEVDPIHQQIGPPGMIGSTQTNGGQQQSPNLVNDALAKHRVRANPNASSSPADMSIDQAPLGKFNDTRSIEHVSEISDKSELSGHDTADKATDMPTCNFPALGTFQKGKELTRFSGISNGSTERGSDTGHGSDPRLEYDTGYGSFPGLESDTGHGSDPGLGTDTGHGSNHHGSVSTLGNSEQDPQELEVC